jgi:hypothetical protein
MLDAEVCALQLLVEAVQFTLYGPAEALCEQNDKVYECYLSVAGKSFAAVF